jgi:hypothetical protein
VEIVHRFGDRVPWQEMVRQRYALDDAGDALAAVASRTVLKAIIAPQSVINAAKPATRRAGIRRRGPTG